MAGVSVTTVYDTLNSLSLPKVSQKIADNITTKIPLLYALNATGHKEYENGGVNYRFPVLNSLPVAQAYTGSTPLNSASIDVVTLAIFNRKQLTADITLTGTELLANSGNDPTSVVDLVTSAIQIAEERMKSTMDGATHGLYSSNGESDLGITGLDNILPTSTSTGTCGGLDRAVYSWWRHQSDSVTTGMNTDGLASMYALHAACNRGDESPNLIASTVSGYTNYERIITGTLSYNTPSPKTQFGDIGFEHLFFRGAVMFPASNCPANSMYFLNTKYLKLIVHRDRDMAIRDFITPTNADTIVGRIYWAGNLVCNNLSSQGLLTGSVDTY